MPDCGRGTIRADAAAAGLPTGRDNFTVSLEFSCTKKDQRRITFWSWGSPHRNSANAFHAFGGVFWAYWFDDDLTIGWPKIGLTSSNVCDGSFHSVASSFDGTTRRIFYAGNQVASDTPHGAHADRNDNLCIGGENFGRGSLFAFVGTIRNFSVWNVALTSVPHL